MEFIKSKGTQLFSGDSPILLRGFGLGGWFLPEGYMWKLYSKCDRPRRMEELIDTLCGTSYSKQFWETYFESYVTESDIEWIAEKGFNSVRMPINARKLYSNTENGLDFDNATIERLDRLINWCKKKNIYVILDMHGAPGGQTGANIDDSEHDLPELCMDDSNISTLNELWRMLALRYKDEPAVAGYDLLNEPLPNWFSSHNDKLMPLYKTLIETIRSVDSRHLIILEGLHWSTDFSIFESLPDDLSLNGIVLEFHKYWSNPDEESLKPYVEASKRLNIPLFMGEGGENNNEWYTTAFPLYERLGISWSFWTYKKMDCNNSPVTFDTPEKWNRIVDWLDNPIEISPSEARAIFDEFLDNIKKPIKNNSVVHALDRSVPVLIPAEAYDDFESHSERIKGANLRSSEPILILFKSGKNGDVDYKRYGGEPQPEAENLVVLLKPSDSLHYAFNSEHKDILCEIQCFGDGILAIEVQNTTFLRQVTDTMTIELPVSLNLNEAKSIVIRCDQGSVHVDTIQLLRRFDHENHTNEI